jgi:hypothetical protein
MLGCFSEVSRLAVWFESIADFWMKKLHLSQGPHKKWIAGLGTDLKALSALRSDSEGQGEDQTGRLRSKTSAPTVFHCRKAVEVSFCFVEATKTLQILVILPDESSVELNIDKRRRLPQRADLTG